MIFELFPEEYIQLNKELYSGLHPKLETILASYGPDEIDIKLAQCAAYVEIGLNGDYTLDDRRQLCLAILVRLINMRVAPPSIILN
jgi:hypothetical protein